MRKTNRRHRGFTLIEVLMVIAIIGILVGLLVPAVSFALKSVKKSAIALEVVTISDAVEKYRSKYGDYPPDGSNAVLATRHIRKIFPQISATELSILSPPLVNSVSGGVMDAPEALVFFLGGFSDDPIYPFSGTGGPLFLFDSSGTHVNSAGVRFDGQGTSTVAGGQYNVDRNGPLFEFRQDQLTLEVNASAITVSTDEIDYFGSAAVNDVLPAYHHASGQTPITYFDARSYTLPNGFNGYGSTATAFGIARPYRSDNINTTAANLDGRFPYMNESSFQVISPGLDDVFGGVPSGAVFYRFPSGQSLEFTSPQPTVGRFTRYSDESGVGAQLDNATNFSEGVLGDSLEN